MNYELAIMALEGLSRAPLAISANGKEILIEGTPASFRELARLFLLLGGDSVEEGEEFELKPPAHLAPGSPVLRMRRTSC